jgi:hypothetical protein
MKIDKRKILLFAFVIIAIISLLVVLFVLPSFFYNPPDLEPSIEKAIDFLELTDEPHALLWLDVIYRRFGIQEFANCSQRYDDILTQLTGEQLQLHVFRRIIDYNNSIQKRDLERFVGIDGIVVPALYCDRFELPDNYAASLEENMSFGEYELTHVLLAVVWMKDNSCKIPLSDNVVKNLYHANSILIDNNNIVEDLELEAAVFLYLAGQGNLVNPDFIEQVIRAQNVDGGWSISGSSQDSDWHPTVLGLLLLLHASSSLDSYPPILPSPS